MEYVSVINALHAAFGATARVISRYNKPAIGEHIFQQAFVDPGKNMNARETKFVVVDLGEVSFHLRALQVLEEGCRLINPHDFLANKATYSSQATLNQAREFSGLGAKYRDALKFIVENIKNHLGGAEVFFGADKNPFEQSVSLYVRQDGYFVAFQFKE